ncbi:MAG: glycoside hydrolase family 38 C-terminal domain-containing protein [Eubacteriales bacterium]|nr:glycoside hydrolase family 38 C-terminal domain-containing protein [Eubacteriales bacterium]
MKPKIHLICNAHLDPVWLWTWHEGAAEAISTFRTAVEFCEKYDGFVFNHNEALLYEWIEEYEPLLFERIQAQVKKGNWHIMGGWYLQPDTQMLSGESLIRHIEAGRKYFDEKFGVHPTVALSLDSFGHTRGLVQILNKTGYDSYIVRRDAPDHYNFKWQGFDGSYVTVHKTYKGYATLRGKAKEKIKEFIDEFIDNPIDGKESIKTGAVFWGIGDHGGGASIPDIEGVEEIAKERDDLEIVQSTPEKFIAEIKNNEMPVKDTSIEHINVGCYISMIRIKQMHRQLENKIDMCEKIMAHAEAECGTEPSNLIDEAKRELMFCQFHDILPGSCIKKAEDDAIQRLGSGITTADKLITKSFFALCAGQERPKNGEIPVIAYNPHPYPICCDLDAEFTLASQNWNEGEYTIAEVYDESGNKLPSQIINPECSIRLDWRKHVTFTAKLEPCSIARFNCKLKVEKLKSLIEPYEEAVGAIVVNNKNGTVKISKKTGLIESYTIGGKERLKKSGEIIVVKDNEDPWGMTVERFEDEIGIMQLMTETEANDFTGYPEENYGSVRVIENGEVRCVIQAFFKYDKSMAVVEYTIPKNQPYIDVKIKMLSNDANRAYKYSIDTCLGRSEFYGQTAFGTQKMLKEGEEVTFHQWCSLRSDNTEVAVINNGTYAGSCRDSRMKLTLLRTPVYAAHPIPKRPLSEPDRYRDHIDMGERCFNFRIAVNENTDNTVDAESLVFNQQPIALSFFTGGDGKKPHGMAELDNKNIILTACKHIGNDAFMIRLYNSREVPQTTKLRFKDTKIFMSFNAFEVKTFIHKNGELKETNMLGE